MTLSDFELGWLAGFLEGEGSFYIDPTHRGYQRKDGSWCTYPRWSIQVQSTDKDSVEYAATLLGVSVTGPYKARGLGKKDYWIASLRKRAEVIELCETLQPYMSKRRQEQIQVLLDAHVARNAIVS